MARMTSKALRLKQIDGRANVCIETFLKFGKETSSPLDRSA